MIYQGFCGPSNPTQSLLADCERTVNLYQEIVESPAAPTGAALYPTPGLSTYLTVADVGLRSAIVSASSRAFCVIGTGFYEIFGGGAFINRGTVAQDTFPATISYNGTTGGQLFITSGGNGYCFVLATNTLTTVLTGEATMGGMIDARFLAFNILNGKVRLSGLNDGTTWDPTLFFQRSLAPDPWQSMLINGNEVWLIGSESGEVWYDSGASPQPFAPIPGAIFRWGTSAPFSAAVAGDFVTWLAKSTHGEGQIVIARGYTPQPISNYAVETAISRYARTSTITNAEVLVYEQEGHLFACFSFPSGPGTWCVDLATQAWHERGTWNPRANRFDVWQPRCYGYAFSKHLVGDRASGKISVLDVTTATESDGTGIRRLRVGPPLRTTGRGRIVIDRLRVWIEPGLGVAAGQGSDPKVMLRTSDDGKTWGSERIASVGAQGQYTKTIGWNRCGSSEGMWVPEISFSEPIPFRIAGAEVEGTGFAASGRAAA